MKKFVYLYMGGSMPASKEEGEKVMASWIEYFKMLGDSVIDSGNPFGSARKTVGGSGMTNATGYSIIKADSLEDAAMMAEKCPQLAAGGSVEVIETMPM